MKPIFEYADYRAYLREHYREKKKENRSYSFRFIARKAGLESPNYFKLVMDGERSLTHRNIRKFAKGLGLGERETLFFENLVYFTQAKNAEEKTFFQKNMEMVRSQDDRAILTKDQHEVLSKWYPLAIKELAQVKDFQTKPKWIAARFDYRFTPQDARDAIDLLARLGLIELDVQSGEIKITQQSIQTPDVTRSEAVAQFHRVMIEYARQAVDKQSSDERCLSALTVAVRKSDLKEAFKRIHQFRNEMDAFFTRSKPYDAVYQLNLQLFRLDTDA